MCSKVDPPSGDLQAARRHGYEVCVRWQRACARIHPVNGENVSVVRSCSEPAGGRRAFDHYLFTYSTTF